MTEERFMTTDEAAALIGIPVDSLYVWLQRNPDYKPANTFGSKSYMWVKSEVDAVIERRANRRKPGRKPK